MSQSAARHHDTPLTTIIDEGHRSPHRVLANKTDGRVFFSQPSYIAASVNNQSSLRVYWGWWRGNVFAVFCSNIRPGHLHPGQCSGGETHQNLRGSWLLSRCCKYNCGGNYLVWGSILPSNNVHWNTQYCSQLSHEGTRPADDRNIFLFSAVCCVPSV